MTGERCCGCVVTGVVYDNAATDAYLAFRIEVDRYNNRSVNLKLNREERVVDTTNSYQLTRAGMSPVTHPFRYTVLPFILRSRLAKSAYSKCFNL